MTKVFIDGSAGTTGLRIRERLALRADITLIEIPDEFRKDSDRRKEALNTADIAFLCLPDAAAKEAVSLIENSGTAVIDTSTAHRVDSGWTYGFPELSGQREKIRSSKRIANPGCHASGFIALVAPLVQAGIILPDEDLSAFSLTGYSGGGKKMIADYEADGRDVLLDSPGMYGLNQVHKHLPEMVKYTGLSSAPVFCPVVAPYYSGMEVIVPLHCADIEEIGKVYEFYYGEGLVRYNGTADSGFIYANKFSGRDDMEITVCGKDERTLLVSCFDNLGKGASGAAIQNMNILMGLDEKTGLTF